jgi:hypothetical protein
LHCEEALSALLVEALVLFARHRVLNDILLILVYQLSDVVVRLRVSELFRADVVLLLLLSIVGVYEDHDAPLIVVLLKLLHVVRVYKGHARFVEDFNPELYVDAQFLLDLREV